MVLNPKKANNIYIFLYKTICGRLRQDILIQFSAFCRKMYDLHPRVSFLLIGWQVYRKIRARAILRPAWRLPCFFFWSHVPKFQILLFLLINGCIYRQTKNNGQRRKLRTYSQLSPSTKSKLQKLSIHLHLYRGCTGNVNDAQTKQGQSMKIQTTKILSRQNPKIKDTPQIRIFSFYSRPFCDCRDILAFMRKM